MFNPITNAKAAIAAAVPASAILMAAPAFAAEPATPGVAITTEMLAPVVDGVTANVGVIMPVAISIFAILIGIRLIPQIIGYFRKGN